MLHLLLYSNVHQTWARCPSDSWCLSCSHRAIFSLHNLYVIALKFHIKSEHIIQINQCSRIIFISALSLWSASAFSFICIVYIGNPTKLESKVNKPIINENSCLYNDFCVKMCWCFVRGYILLTVSIEWKNRMSQSLFPYVECFEIILIAQNHVHWWLLGHHGCLQCIICSSSQFWM